MIETAWQSLPPGARAAIEQQWAGLAAGGLPCGASVVDAAGSVVAVGRNHSYDAAGDIVSRLRLPLQHNRLAHAEMNALALISTETDHASLTVWSTQHPCSMCAAAIRFTGVGRVCFVADDPSNPSSAEEIAATHGDVPYEPLGSRRWATICNLLFLYNSAVQQGTKARNIERNAERHPDLVRLTLELAKDDALGRAARAGTPLPEALHPYFEALIR